MCQIKATSLQGVRKITAKLKVKTQNICILIFRPCLPQIFNFTYSGFANPLFSAWAKWNRKSASNLVKYINFEWEKKIKIMYCQFLKRHRKKWMCQFNFTVHLTEKQEQGEKTEDIFIKFTKDFAWGRTFNC